MVIFNRLLNRFANRFKACKMYNSVYLVFFKYLFERFKVKKICLIKSKVLACYLLYSVKSLRL